MNRRPPVVERRIRVLRHRVRYPVAIHVQSKIKGRFHWGINVVVIRIHEQQGIRRFADPASLQWRVSAAAEECVEKWGFERIRSAVSVTEAGANPTIPPAGCCR